MSETKCETCDRPLPPEEDGDIVFCSARCYGAYVSQERPA